MRRKRSCSVSKSTSGVSGRSDFFSSAASSFASSESPSDFSPSFFSPSSDFRSVTGFAGEDFLPRALFSVSTAFLSVRSRLVS